MSLDYQEVSCLVLTEDSIKQLFGSLYEEVTSFMYEKGTSLDECIYHVLYGDGLEGVEEEDVPLVLNELDEFLCTISNYFHVPMDIGYHDSENYGCKDDEVSGGFIYVSDHHIDELEAKRFGSYFHVANYTVMG